TKPTSRGTRPSRGSWRRRRSRWRPGASPTSASTRTRSGCPPPGRRSGRSSGDRPDRREPSSPTTATADGRSSRSWPSRSSCEGSAMSEVLVLVDHVNGTVRKTTTELLTIARRLGEPSAVFIGAGYEQATSTLAAFGAQKVYLLEQPELSDYLVAPKAEALAQLAERAQPVAILLPSDSEGKEVAGRLAIKLESGLVTDAVDVEPGEDGIPVTTQSVFAGTYTVRAAVTKGT